MTVLVPTREVNGQLQYWCKFCNWWVNGRAWDGTGYTALICEGCDSTLDDDLYGHHVYEAREGREVVK